MVRPGGDRSCEALVAQIVSPSPLSHPAQSASKSRYIPFTPDFSTSQSMLSKRKRDLDAESFVSILSDPTCRCIFSLEPAQSSAVRFFLKNRNWQKIVCAQRLRSPAHCCKFQMSSSQCRVAGARHGEFAPPCFSRGVDRAFCRYPAGFPRVIAIELCLVVAKASERSQWIALHLGSSCTVETTNYLKISCSKIPIKPDWGDIPARSLRKDIR